MGLKSTDKVKNMDEELMSIGKNLKKIRTRKNLTQGQLSEMAEISLNQVSRIERGTAKPELETIKKLAKSLHCSADELIFNDDDYITSDELRLLFSAVEDLSEDKQQMIKDFIEAMLMKSDMEKWVNKTNKNIEQSALKTSIEANFSHNGCKECGGKMLEEEVREDQKQNGIKNIYRCSECGWMQMYTENKIIETKTV